MGHAVEEPEAVLDIGSRLAEKQPLREVSAAGKFQFAFFGVFRIGSQAIEALAVFVCRTQQRRSWIEPGQQPGVDRGGIEAVRLHTGISEAASQAFADDIQRLFGDCPRRAGALPTRR